MNRSTDNNQNMSSVIEIDQVSKRFGKLIALDSVSFRVEPGTVFALLGENGAGKTTSIKILLGLLRPDGGTSHVLGFRSSRQSRQIRQTVGYVPEQPSLYEWMTVYEIGWFTAGFYGTDFLPRYIEMIKGYEVELGSKIGEISKGMRAKVALALALASDPDLLILDEPTSGLDAMVRREFLESMVDRAATGKAVFLSSHQIHEVERVADVVAILRKGKLIVVESLDDLKSSTTELVLTTTVGWDETNVELPGKPILVETAGRQTRAIVRDALEAEIDALRSHPAVEVVKSKTPSLEEIFIACMRGPEDETEVD